MTHDEVKTFAFCLTENMFDSVGVTEHLEVETLALAVSTEHSGFQEQALCPCTSGICERVSEYALSL